LEIFVEKGEEASETPSDSSSSSSHDTMKANIFPFALTKNLITFLTLYLTNIPTESSSREEILFDSFSTRISELLDEVRL
jgi:hypothetical protein